MIDAEDFEKNFMAHHKEFLDKCDVGIVRLYAPHNNNAYRTVQFLAGPFDEEIASAGLGYLRTEKTVGKYELELTVENIGRGEDEIILKPALLIEVSDYKSDDNEQILEAIKRLKLARENSKWTP